MRAMTEQEVGSSCKTCVTLMGLAMILVLAWGLVGPTREAALSLPADQWKCADAKPTPAATCTAWVRR